MEGSIIVGKSTSNVINFDVVQCGVARNINEIHLFAIPTKKVKENSVTPEPITVERNNVMVNNGTVSRFVVKDDKKARTISKSNSKHTVERVMDAIDHKYRHPEKAPNR